MKLLLGLAALLLQAASVAHGAEAIHAWDKVHPLIVSQATAGGEAEVLIFMDKQANLSEVAALRTKVERGRRVYELLSDTAGRTQGPLLAWLAAREIPHRPYWIANAIWARVDLDQLGSIAARFDVRRIDANPRVRLDRLPESDQASAPQAPASIEWGILKTNADDVWALGYDGSGIVIAGQDTGYDWDHPALIEHYRGWNGSNVDHDYNWHDAIHSGGGDCGSDSPVPCDDHDHGTHTMGTMVGDDGGSNRIGMAPGARWIGCRNMEEGYGWPATYIECFQFIVAPTDLAGNNPDPSKAPHVVSNSWGCPESEGCEPETLQTIVDNTRAAGIVIVASAGNSGSSCESIEEPPGIYAGVLTVGSTDSSDEIADSSGRGPIDVDGSDRLKPDVTAPGVGVRSARVGGGYGQSNGTSMAAPHVAGLVALLLDARPDLIGRVDEIEQIVRLSAVPRTHNKKCGDIPGSQIPNPHYGHGRIDALEALTGDVDGDGVGNLTDCLPVDASVWLAPDAAGGLTVTRSASLPQLSWNAPVASGSSGVHYDLLRSDRADDFTTATCLLSDAAATQATDASAPGGLSFYLVRAENGCEGNLGSGSAAQPRVGIDCVANP